MSDEHTEHASNAEASRRGWGLRPTLLSVVVLLIFSGAGVVGAVAYTNSRAIVDKLWQQLAHQLVASTTQRTLRYFAPAPPYVQLTRRQVRSGILTIGTFDETTLPRALLDHFHAAIKANPQFTWASFGAADGTYIAAQRTASGTINGVWRTAREGKPTIMRVLRRGADGRWVIKRRFDGTYSPLIRPWYRAAVARKGNRGAWSDPFVFATIKQPGFMYTWAYRPPAGSSNSPGVFAVEYEMSALSRFLSKLRVAKHGRVYIVSNHGDVVGHPAGQTTATRDGKLAVARVDGHPDKMLRAAWVEVKRRLGEDPHAAKQASEFRAGKYLVMAAPFPPQTGIRWLVVVVVPEADFFGEVRAQALRTLLIALFGALLAVMIGALFSNRVSAALRAIATELERVGRFDLEDKSLEQQKRSVVREINEMRDITLRMKRSLRSFGKYVPKELVRELIVSGEEAELGGRKAELSVLFSDIAGFTTVAEKLAPDVLVEVLAEYLQGMSHAIRAEGGTVDKYIGDAIMAFWGAPHEDAEHAVAACRGALAMKRKLAELQKGWDERGLPRFDTRIGINTGDVLVGNFGAPDRLNYTVMGDPVNVASRLEALNKAYGTALLIGERTADLVGDRFELRLRDYVAVKGKAEAVGVFELCGARGEVSDEEVAMTKRYTAALEHYRARRFVEARERFEALAKRDVGAARMVERCLHYEAEPPPEDWDGRTTMTSK